MNCAGSVDWVLHRRGIGEEKGKIGKVFSTLTNTILSVWWSVCLTKAPTYGVLFGHAQPRVIVTIFMALLISESRIRRGRTRGMAEKSDVEDFPAQYLAVPCLLPALLCLAVPE